ncbi:BTAD domain-containing putative transcriptional regulator [Amycolatopsis sp. NPDC059090]|uniref:BTAD domain-containing putative transcriptional regulator n=1 Tax=Amycolatopsis sp. NPDC059090 TaxID=3346723 RepID=UPI003671C591
MAEPDPLSLQILGSVQAWRGSQEIRLGPARQRAVFVLLALRTGRHVGRPELIAAVWGDDPPASVNGNIHTYLSGLRRALEPDRSHRAAGAVLSSESGRYSLQIAGENIDAIRFERLIATMQAAKDPVKVAAAANEALALWRGNPLSGLPGPFAERERDRLADLRLSALEHRARAALDLGRHRELAPELTALVREHPLQESLHATLMLALYRSGRHSEALEAFQHARRTLVRELGVEPGSELRELQARILDHDPELAAAPTAGAPRRPQPLDAVPPNVAPVLAQPGPLLGRDAELALLRGLVEDVRAGRGGAAWVEGEIGIGKSTLLAAALAGVRGAGGQLGWAVSDELRARVPLRVVLDCLGVDPASSDPVRSALAGDLFRTGENGGIWGDTDSGMATVGRLLTLVDELCAQSPVVLVMDDIQWADEMSVQFWRRLYAATRQLPLLLVIAARPAPRSNQLARLRHDVETRGGHLLALQPLTDSDAVRLQESILGAEVGPALRELVAEADGSPLYIKELTDAARRENALVSAAGVVDLASAASFSAPGSLAATLRRRLHSLPGEVRDTLKVAALLGAEFTVTELAAVLGKSPLDLVPLLEESVRGNLLVDSGTKLAFRHPVLWHTFYHWNPPEAHPQLHRKAAEALSEIGAPVTGIAEQLAMANFVDTWVLTWLAEHHDPLASRAPQLAADLMSLALAECSLEDPLWEVLAASLVKVLFRLDRDPMELARKTLAVAKDPYRAAETRQLLSVMHVRRGETAEAVAMLEAAAGDKEVPDLWRRRHKHLLANFRRGGLDDLDAAESAAKEAFEAAAGDEYLTAHALQTLWLLASVRRDHEAALVHANAAISVVRPVAELADLHVDLLDNRLFTLENLNLLDEADDTLRTAHRVAAEHALPAALQVSAAVHYYWVGRWNEAVVELDSVTEDGPAITFYGLREPPAAVLLLHGVAALIAGRRGDTIQAAVHLDAANAFGPVTEAERESFDFLLMAQSLEAEQRGDLDGALAVLLPILTPTYAQMMLRHQWLPYVARLALSAGDFERAQLALEICDEEAAKERAPARAAAAANWCRGLVAGQPGPVLAAAYDYREVGRPVELAMAMEDAAVLLARTGEAGQAAASFHQATQIYANLSAKWDLERAQRRLAEFGVHRGAEEAPLRPDRGWASLSPVEVKIATMVAAGRSNPDIAARLELPRRTVQAHVHRLLSKLDLPSRTGITDHVADRKS